MRIFKAGVLYFVLVFGTGFLLGTVRTFWVVPRLGSRTAELVESPIMFAVTIVAARFVVRRFALPASASVRLTVGGIALVLIILAEFGFVLWLRGMSVSQYFATRDMVAAAVYYSMILLYAVMPWLVVRE